MSVCVLGSINLDMVFRVAALPRPGETVQSLGFEQHPGGKGANQAVAAARMGAQTQLIAAVGGDAAGAELTQFLGATEVELSAVMKMAAPTGRAIICVDAGGENCIVVDSGANAALSPADLPQALGRHGVFLAQLETPLETLAAFFASGAARAGITILNAAPAEARALALFPLIDILIVNQSELASYAKLSEEPVDLDAVATAARGLMARPDQAAVVTLGGAGAALVTATEATLIPGRAVKVVDTTGAGDCFCGALAAFLDEGMTLSAALAYANAAAALAVGRAGAASSIPTRNEVDASLLPSGVLERSA